MTTEIEGVVIKGDESYEAEKILTPQALKFLKDLHKTFNKRRLDLLKEREKRDQSETALGFLKETKKIRSDTSWKVAEAPDDLQRRRVEITGPTDRKMVINALNSGADVFMADFEDSNSPTWSNMIEGQLNLRDAVRETISLETPEGKKYELSDHIATLLVRPRGWHLNEKHILIDGEEMSGSLFDFGLYFFHNVHERIKRGTAPYFYLPKMEHHLEARLWNDVFVHAQEELSVPKGTVRATVLIETLPAAFQMEEILYELRDHASGLNAGRWDYIFSVIKCYRRSKEVTFPDRAQITMTVPFMHAYSNLIVQTCHKRGAHAMGGMSAYIPSRKDPTVNEKALLQVKNDKRREADEGFDGTWVAHPDLVPIAMDIFDEQLGHRPNQKNVLREDLHIKEKDLLNFTIPEGAITKAGLHTNVSVGIRYLASWLGGVGAAAIDNLMEDAATAEISRAQVWQWLVQEATMEGDGPVTPEVVKQVIEEECASFEGYDSALIEKGKELFEEIVFTDKFIPFFTLLGYKELP